MIRWPLATVLLCSCAELIGITDERSLEVVELTVSAGTLSPGFDPAITHYQLDVGYPDAMLEVHARANDPGAAIAIAGLEAVAGTAVASVAIGDSTVEVVAHTDSGVVATYELAIHRGDLEIGFAPPRSVPTQLPGMVDRVEIVDLDGDGRLDLAPITGNGEIGMLTNNGAAQFTFRYTFAYGFIREVALRDLNADGRPELIVNAANQLQVAHNRGGAEFDPPISCGGGTPSPGAFTIFQLNTDGIPDLALADQNGRLLPMSGTASMCFTSMPAMDQTVSPTQLTVVQSGVLDAQAGEDIATLDPSAGRIFVHRNLGGGLSLDQVDIGPPTSRPAELALADTDGDGRAELIWIDASTEEVVVQPFPGPRGPSFHIGGHPRALTVFDLDGDGRPDIVVVDDNGLTVLHNERGPGGGAIGAGSFSNKALAMPLSGVQRLAFGDLDGDGRADLVTANFTSSVNVHLGVAP